jgi:predicted O-methyltransferase YrrM
MYSPLQLAKRYARYFLTASNGKGHGMHSPSVYAFIREVLMDKKHYPAYNAVEDLKSRLLQDETRLHVEDLGAGSRTVQGSSRSVASICRSASKPTRIGRLLFRMVQYYQPRSILELGTSLGLSSAYMASAKRDTTLTTIEGSSAIAAKAVENFTWLGLTNVKLVQGNFDDVLPRVLDDVAPDLVFVDGNHRFEPTMRYFRMLRDISREHTILIFDDIHWSAEMEAAWKAIGNDESVRATIDLFFVGIVLFNTRFKEKQNFSIRF